MAELAGFEAAFAAGFTEAVAEVAAVLDERARRPFGFQRPPLKSLAASAPGNRTESNSDYSRTVSCEVRPGSG
ncbi:MAG: hypothetical protein ACRDSH_22115, partial [Pseudonocardiaceae bacterium]